MPALPGLLERVKRSCASAAQGAGAALVVEVDHEAAAAFAKGLDVVEVEDAGAKAPGCRFPVRFDSLAEEVNFIALLSMLSVGGGLRAELHKAIDAGAHSTIMRGVLGIYLSGSKLDADFLADFNVGLCSQYFGIPTHHEVPAEGLQGFATVSQPGGPLRGLLDALVRMMKDTGRVLKELRAESLGAHILATANNVVADGPPRAASLVQELVRAFPLALSDTAEWAGSEVLFHARAQLIAAQLHRRFKDSADTSVFNFVDADALTLVADTVIPCMLSSAGVLKLSATLTQKIEDGVALKAGGEEEVLLRAAGVAAGEAIVEACGGAFAAWQLSFFLWGRMGKEGDMVAKKRHAVHDGFMY